MVAAEHKSDFARLTGELWGVHCKDFGENWSRYNGTALNISYKTCTQLRCAMFRLSLSVVRDSFIHIIQSCFTGTGAIIYMIAPVPVK